MKKHPAEPKRTAAEALCHGDMPMVSGGMNEEAILFAQTETVCCPHCRAEAIHVMWYSVKDSITYYSCPNCGRDFYGRVCGHPLLSVQVFSEPLCGIGIR